MRARKAVQWAKDLKYFNEQSNVAEPEESELTLFTSYLVNPGFLLL